MMEVPVQDGKRFEAITFDCYGTLVDWESGILAALGPVLRAHRIEAQDDALLARYAELESAAEAGAYHSYREVLRAVVAGFGAALGFEPTRQELACLETSLPHWRPFPDTVAALSILAKRFRLGVISNVDDDLFSHTAKALGVHFDLVVTAQQVGAYKPAVRLFHCALRALALPAARVLHAAQSLYHDVVPAQSLGMSTVWVQRRRAASGFGATPPATATPDLVVPDLQSLVNLLRL